MNLFAVLCQIVSMMSALVFYAVFPCARSGALVILLPVGVAGLYVAVDSIRRRSRAAGFDRVARHRDAWAAGSIAASVLAIILLFVAGVDLRRNFVSVVAKGMTVMGTPAPGAALVVTLRPEVRALVVTERDEMFYAIRGVFTLCRDDLGGPVMDRIPVDENSGNISFDAIPRMIGGRRGRLEKSAFGERAIEHPLVVRLPRVVPECRSMGLSFHGVVRTLWRKEDRTYRPIDTPLNVSAPIPVRSSVRAWLAPGVDGSFFLLQFGLPAIVIGLWLVSCAGLAGLFFGRPPNG